MITITITWSGVLMVIGGVALLYFVGYLLFVLWAFLRWGK